jgi:hypothetical protein
LKQTLRVLAICGLWLLTSARTSFNDTLINNSIKNENIMQGFEI